MTAGEVACGLCIDFYAWAQVRIYGPEVIGFVLPRDLTVVNGDAIAILKGAPDRKLAEAFVAFVEGEAGQRLFMLNRGEPGGPVNHDLAKFSVIPRLYGSCRAAPASPSTPSHGRAASGTTTPRPRFAAPSSTTSSARSSSTAAPSLRPPGGRPSRPCPPMRR